MSRVINRILVTNDDGIDAPGIKLLENIALSLCSDVWVVAPTSERSGAGHSISLTNPIRSKKLSEKKFEVEGTPTDCVLMGLWQFMGEDHLPDLVLSGINSGANLAEDVSYSGTIAAAMEATLMGIPAISLSQVRPPRGKTDFLSAKEHAQKLVHKLVKLEDWPKDSLININFPDCSGEETAGIEVTSQGHRPPGSFTIEPRVDARNQPYYWVRINHIQGNELPGTDLSAIALNKISVTTIKMNFTDEKWNDCLKTVL